MFITSYCTDLRKFIDTAVVDKFELLFHYIADICIEFTRKNGKFPCPGNGPFVVNHIIKLIQCYLARFQKTTHDGDDIEIPKDIEDRLNNALLFGVIWGIGGCLEEVTRPRFDNFLQEMIAGEDVVLKYQVDLGEAKQDLMKIPHKLNMGDSKSLFDLYFD